MIVKYLWESEDRKNPGWKKFWRGWFLFGFIPLYIEQEIGGR